MLRCLSTRQSLFCLPSQPRMCCFLSALPNFMTLPPMRQLMLPRKLMNVKQSEDTQRPDCTVSGYSSTKLNASSKPSSYSSLSKTPVEIAVSTAAASNSSRQNVFSRVKVTFELSSDQKTCFRLEAKSILLTTSKHSQSQNVIDSLLLKASNLPPKIPSQPASVLKALIFSKFL